MLNLCQTIYREIQKYPNEVTPYYDFLNAAKSYISSVALDNHGWNVSTEVPRTRQSEEVKAVHRLNYSVQSLIRENIQYNIGEFFNIYSQSLLMEAPYDFEQFMYFVELNRPPEEKFYQPRQKTLAPLLHSLQDLEDDLLDELLLSLPPRTGKTAMLSFFISWLMGRHPNNASLYTAFSNTITKTFYKGVLEIIQDPVTYRWQEVFPSVALAETNAQDQTVNLARKTRYPSLTCRSIDGTLNGACDCDCMSIADDLCSGIEQALNKDRMNSLWQKVTNDYLSRSKSQAKQLWCGTRWSNIDPIGLREEMLTNDGAFRNRRFRVINVPAMDENDESNFDYAYGVGFATEDFRMKRAGFERTDDMPSWFAQYMGEPIERAGNLFEPGEMRFYNGDLPNKTPERIFMAVDPAFGSGKDHTAAPVVVQYGDDLYIPDVVYSPEDKDHTMPLLIAAIKKFGVETIQFEANKTLQSYIDEFKFRLRKAGVHCTVLTKPAPPSTSKEQRIFDKAPEVREHMVFLDGSSRQRHYQQFMNGVFGFKMMAKNQRDDAPDSLSMAISMVFKYAKNDARVFERFI